MKITVVGTGYLGATHAACLAYLGHDVLGVDADATTVDTLSRGRAPFREPGLDDLLSTGIALGRLRFTTSLADAAAHARVHLLCVGTPQSADSWAADTTALDAVIDGLVPLLRGRHLIIGKSTVPVGTAARLGEGAATLAVPGTTVPVCWSPEFLREGHGVADTLHPDRSVLGVPEDPEVAAGAEAIFREIWAAPLQHSPLVVTDLQTAEMVKLSANAFLATTISFINAVADLCDATGADVTTVSSVLGMDPRIGAGALTAGVGFGGGCLPKDLRSFGAATAELDLPVAGELFRAVDAVNRHSRRRLIGRAVDACGGCVMGTRIAVLGAAFKPGCDDVRDSPALAVAAGLRDAGAQVSVYDPVVSRGAGRDVDSVAEALRDAELVVVGTAWPQFRDIDPVEARELVARPVLIDGTNSLSARRWADAGWDYRGTGYPARSVAQVPGWKPASTADTAN
ncbi:UDP-glucose dehydrogenase family protein [Corynebacterium terpenotabidum]|uniref:UDP-glucose 6-dehydrogenase n=1 Tax=Corynebacterium terpenotabidum Y-11 TaxID=1200352 RepID=S4XGZ3_9CORY|nr:UDP-glucose/GDP-mannose dehydrogenase family protein [Corynebacterium terpenotabidum]AGP29918.1 UDP-glucose 6-dehydrogenase [Corynebacterium terpenotabidum Y-11]